jgi:hypothetical protein
MQAAFSQKHKGGEGSVNTPNLKSYHHFVRVSVVSLHDLSANVFLHTFYILILLMRILAPHQKLAHFHLLLKNLISFTRVSSPIRLIRRAMTT